MSGVCLQCNLSSMFPMFRFSDKIHSIFSAISLADKTGLNINEIYFRYFMYASLQIIRVMYRHASFTVITSVWKTLHKSDSFKKEYSKSSVRMWIAEVTGMTSFDSLYQDSYKTTLNTSNIPQNYLVYVIPSKNIFKCNKICKLLINRLVNSYLP